VRSAGVDSARGALGALEGDMSATIRGSIGDLVDKFLKDPSVHTKY
jgi:hypothetical protein